MEQQPFLSPSSHISLLLQRRTLVPFLPILSVSLHKLVHSFRVMSCPLLQLLINFLTFVLKVGKDALFEFGRNGRVSEWTYDCRLGHLMVQADIVGKRFFVAMIRSSSGFIARFIEVRIVDKDQRLDTHEYLQ